jgi:hypothetical protein
VLGSPLAATLLVLCALQPNISMRMGDPAQPTNILSSPAILSNTGIFPIYDISVSCTGPGTIIETGGKTVFPAVSRLNGTTQIKRLGAGQAIAARDICKSPTIEHPKRVNAVIRVGFKPLLLYPQSREFRIASVAWGLDVAVSRRPRAGSQPIVWRQNRFGDPRDPSPPCGTSLTLLFPNAFLTTFTDGFQQPDRCRPPSSAVLIISSQNRFHLSGDRGLRERQFPFLERRRP